MFAQREREALEWIPEHALERGSRTDCGYSWLRYFEAFAHLKGTDLMVHLPRCCTVTRDAHTHRDFFVPCSSLPHKKTNRVGQERGMRKFSPGLLSFPLGAVIPGQRSLHFTTPQILKENSKTQSYTQDFSYFKPSSWSRTDLST